MLLTSAANAGFEHPCLGGRGDEGIGGQQGEPHHPPGVHLSLGGTALPYGCLRKFACSPFRMSQLITRAAFICPFASVCWVE